MAIWGRFQDLDWKFWGLERNFEVLSGNLGLDGKFLVFRREISDSRTEFWGLERKFGCSADISKFRKYGPTFFRVWNGILRSWVEILDFWRELLGSWRGFLSWAYTLGCGRNIWVLRGNFGDLSWNFGNIAGNLGLERQFWGFERNFGLELKFWALAVDENLGWWEIWVFERKLRFWGQILGVWDEIGVLSGNVGVAMRNLES